MLPKGGGAQVLGSSSAVLTGAITESCPCGTQAVQEQASPSTPQCQSLWLPLSTFVVFFDVLELGLSKFR